MSDRIDKNLWFMKHAELSSKRASCCRKQVGCVLVNARGEVVSTGYNGPPRGVPNCTKTEPCHIEAIQDNTTSFTLCEAVHAEQNALLQCHDIWDIETCYVTLSPCLSCVKMLLNTSCQHIVFKELYHTGAKSLELWESVGRKWIHLKE